MLSATQSSTLLRCEQLRVGYAGVPISPAFDLSIEPGELIAVVGRNGSGKTTWFRTLLGLLAPVSGHVIQRPGLRRSYVPQRSQLDPMFPLLARDVVALGAERGLSCLHPRLSRPPEVRAALERTGITAFADRPYRALSEGQKQRVLLARLCASSPELALLDEPTSAMDAVAERETLQLLADLRRERGTSIVVISHYLGSIRELADRVILFDSERKNVLVGAPDEVLSHALYHRNYPGTVDDACEAH
jgi:zinc transport system ATP-binding protein